AWKTGGGGGGKRGGQPKGGKAQPPPCLGRRRLALSLPRQNQPASAITPGEGVQADPSYQLEGADTIMQTLPTVKRQREKCQPGGCRYRAGTECFYVGHCPGGPADFIEHGR